MVVPEVPTNVPDEISDHESLVAIIYHHGVGSLPIKADGSNVKTIPQMYKSKIASSTGGCSGDYDSNSDKKKENWWHRHFDNFRYFVTNGLEGQPATPSTQEKMQITQDFYTERFDHCLAHAMMCFCREAGEDDLKQLISWMGQDPMLWIPFIRKHGQPCRASREPMPLTKSAVSPEISASRFKIWSGIPGTGKSYATNQLAKQLVEDPDKDIFRTIFHPEYSFYDFVGQIQPSVGSDGTISYPFFSGPFTRAMKRANELLRVQPASGPPRPVILCIEELNRGNAAAIFGEVFQLLDLDETGESEYGITIPHVAGEIGLAQDTLIKIPKNMYIFSTMNTSDQNIFSLDTAFLRRWDRVHVPVDAWQGEAENWQIQCPAFGPVSWRHFATSFNDWLIEHAATVGIPNPEDKRLGPWFLEQRHCDSTENFANKVLPYLWTNVFTHTQARQWAFSENCSTLERLIEQFLTHGCRIFNEKFYSKVIPPTDDNSIDLESE